MSRLSPQWGKVCPGPRGEGRDGPLPASELHTLLWVTTCCAMASWQVACPRGQAACSTCPVHLKGNVLFGFNPGRDLLQRGVSNGPGILTSWQNSFGQLPSPVCAALASLAFCIQQIIWCARQSKPFLSVPCIPSCCLCCTKKQKKINLEIL